MIDCPPAFDDLRIETIMQETPVAEGAKTVWTYETDVHPTRAFGVVTPDGWTPFPVTNTVPVAERLPADGQPYPVVIFLPEGTTDGMLDAPVTLSVLSARFQTGTQPVPTELSSSPADDATLLDVVVNDDSSVDRLMIDRRADGCALLMNRMVPSVDGSFLVATKLQDPSAIDLFRRVAVLASVTFTPTLDAAQK